MSDSNILLPLLKEAIRWGLHDDECKSFAADFDDIKKQDKLCNCWLSIAKAATQTNGSITSSIS